ncbi:PHP domain-containing protein [Halalkalicoccus subterraneus]|uniref:PHP domain-containing protein n=1 Tax=Halalkalicoccus subterraneus TaxID=2675002 RepID=UPI000EFBBAC4|nr:PHP domain-containing protein [Halalkalicoccus subterraneus]
MEDSIYADLHVHTTNSDGELVLDEVPAVAADVGISAVAITDHDRLHPKLDAPRTRIDGIDVIHGIELRVEVAPLDERIDLLGYGVSESPALRDELDRLQKNRKNRATRIVDLIENELGIELDVAIDGGTGRPHIARAIDAHPDIDLSYQEAFDELIADGRPCYVPREIPPFETGIELLSETCGVVSLAHPYRYEDPEAVLELAPRLDAVECRYPYSSPNIASSSDLDVQTAERQDLLLTGGSDAHTNELGQAGIRKSQYERLLDTGGFKG